MCRSKRLEKGKQEGDRPGDEIACPLRMPAFEGDVRALRDTDFSFECLTCVEDSSAASEWLTIGRRRSERGTYQLFACRVSLKPGMERLSTAYGKIINIERWTLTGQLSYWFLPTSG